MIAELRPEFVEFIPKQTLDGVLYVSIEYATAVHRCCCGCGNKVVTPLSPASWSLTFDGETVSLDPSIGNWSFDCRSHYWINRNRVEWAPSWSAAEVASGRHAAARRLARHLDRAPGGTEPPDAVPRTSWWRRWLRRFVGMM